MSCKPSEAVRNCWKENCYVKLSQTDSLDMKVRPLKWQFLPLHTLLVSWENVFRVAALVTQKLAKGDNDISYQKSNWWRCGRLNPTPVKHDYELQWVDFLNAAMIIGVACPLLKEALIWWVSPTSIHCAELQCKSHSMVFLGFVSGRRLLRSSGVS